MKKWSALFNNTSASGSTALPGSTIRTSMLMLTIALQTARVTGAGDCCRSTRGCHLLSVQSSVARKHPPGKRQGGYETKSWGVAVGRRLLLSTRWEGCSLITYFHRL